MLVPVDEIFRPRTQDEIAETREPLVNIRVALVASGRRVVGDVDIHPREEFQRPPDFLLFIKVMPSWLIAPTPVETAGAHP